MDDPTLEQFARRARLRPAFLAWAFDEYDRLCGPAAAGLPAHLGLSPRDFLRLGLYLRPRPDHFDADVRRAAGDFDIDPFLLAAVARFVDAAEAMRPTGGAAAPSDGSADAPGYLAAARWRRGRGKGGET